MSRVETTLARKLKRQGTARSPLPDSEFVGQALARQIEKGLKPLVKAPVSALLLSQEIVKVSKALEDVSVPAMLCLVGIERAKLQGLLMLDADLAYHVIDLMLGGDAAVAPPPITRTFTAIDMSLCGLAQSTILAGVGEAIAAAFDRPFAGELAIAGQMQDITQVRFTAPHVDALVYTIVLDIGPAARSGVVKLFLPLGLLDVVCATMRTETGERPPEEETFDLWAIQMRRAAAVAPVTFDAVLHAQKMPLDRAMQLAVGDVVEIPDTAVGRISLRVTQRDGTRIELATGKLGSYRGAKVVKLHESIDDRARRHVARALREA